MTDREYTEAIEALFVKFPSFQNAGGDAYKPGLDRMYRIDKALGSPSSKLRCVHVAGTNGKGSVSHITAAALMQLPKELAAGYPVQPVPGSMEKIRVGLYTSPHLADFRERIKVDGEMVPKEWVYSFLQKNEALFGEHDASFFEITTAMAFCYFAEMKVDIAVIECGLGGRLDSTNIITPIVSVITNIGLDHCDYLGGTLAEIAMEKSGIIKRGVPAVLGENDGEGVREVFENAAESAGSTLYIAEKLNRYNPFALAKHDGTSDKSLSTLATCILSSADLSAMDLKGDCQKKNIRTASTAIALILKKFSEETKIGVTEAHLACIFHGIENAAHITGLRGRWERLSDNPLVICDIGHNSHGMKTLMPQVMRTAREHRKFFFIFGIMRDKDLDSETEYLPHDAMYLYVNAKSDRAMQAEELGRKMTSAGFAGEAVTADSNGSSIGNAIEKALGTAAADDFIFIGGSSYVVAEALGFFRK